MSGVSSAWGGQFEARRNFRVESLLELLSHAVDVVLMGERQPHTIAGSVGRAARGVGFALMRHSGASINRCYLDSVHGWVGIPNVGIRPLDVGDQQLVSYSRARYVKSLCRIY